MNVLVIANGPVYGSELPFNALRLPTTLQRDGVQVCRFVMGDAVDSAIGGQQLPDGYGHLDRMIRGLSRRGGEVGSSSPSDRPNRRGARPVGQR